MLTIKAYPVRMAPINPIDIGIDCSKTKTFFSATYFLVGSKSFVGYGSTRKEATENLLDVVYNCAKNV